LRESTSRRFAAALLPEPQALISQKLYYGPMLQGLGEGLLEAGIMLRPVHCMQLYQQQRFLETPRGFYAGLAFMGTIYACEGFIRRVAGEMSCPKVMVDHHFEDLAMHSVRDDAQSGMRALTEHLVGLGHRHVAYLDKGSPEANPWKREGVREALLAAGLPALERGWVAGCRDNFADVSAALEWFMDLSPRPTAVVCFDDTRALLALQAAAERGMRVPEDLSVAGYGDEAVRTGRSQVLTSMHIDAEQMGRRAAELLVRGGGAEPVALMLAPELRARASTAAPGGRG